MTFVEQQSRVRVCPKQSHRREKGWNGTEWVVQAKSRQVMVRQVREGGFVCVGEVVVVVARSHLADPNRAQEWKLR